MIWFRKILLLLAIGMFSLSSYAQIDTKFWFVAPEITYDHNKDTPIYFVFSSQGFNAQVRISQPANASFTPININVPAGGTFKYNISARVDMLENLFDTKDGIPGKSNKGILIEATSPITAYYEVGPNNNPDIFSLKGNNALGSEFFTSFQTAMYNVNKNYNTNCGCPANCWSAPAYSSFDIVFTEDNTYITIYIPTDSIGKKRLYKSNSQYYTDSVTLGPFNAGETYTGIPFWRYYNEAGCVKKDNDYYGRSAEDHLAGVQIIAHEQNNKNKRKKIAVTLKDDSMKSLVGGCYDAGGDQTIPVNIIGTKYIAMRGQLDNGTLSSWYKPPPTETIIMEKLFILATQDGTDININGLYITTINKSVTYEYSIPIGQDYVSIEASKPVYVLQISGFGCEMGEAILPPIDKCTGSREVSFTRSTNEGFYMNIMVRDGAKDSFKVSVNGVIKSLIAGTSFTKITGTDWWAARLGPFTTTQIPVGATVKIWNTQDLFHLGIINGNSTSGVRFGYFSDFKEVKADAHLVLPDLESQNAFQVRGCRGNTFQLYAREGANTYQWIPEKYLDNPFSRTPVLFPPIQDTINKYAYQVVVTGSCNIKDTSELLTIQVFDPPTALFNIDKNAGCSPLTVNITDSSLNAYERKWNINNDTIFKKYSLYNFSHTFYNNTDTVQEYFIMLVVDNASRTCRDTLIRTITVYPAIKAGFTPNSNITGCHPVNIQFINTSRDSTGDEPLYKWNFGDGATSNLKNPFHSFSNYASDDTVFNVSLVAISQYFCSDTQKINVTVHPYIKADFTMPDPQGCSPHRVNIANISTGADDNKWYFGDGNTSTLPQPGNHVYYVNASSPPLISEIKLVVRNNEGCSDSISKPITIYPYIKAGFSVNNYTSSCQPVKVKFIDTSTVSATSLYWDFGDGASDTSHTIEHTFENFSTSSPAIYNVRLIATSQYFCADTTPYYTISVYPKIHAGFTADTSVFCSPFIVNFDRSTTFGANSFNWNFDDGEQSNSSNILINHKFNNNTSNTLIRNVKLKVTNTAYGCSDSIVRPLTVYPKPDASFTAVHNGNCQPLETQFNYNNADNVATSFIWTLGNGNTSSDKNPQTIYYNSSNKDTIFNIKVISISEDFCTDTATGSILVHPYVKANFSMPVAEGCQPFNISFTNLSEQANDYSWTFGDGKTSKIASPSHTFTNSNPNADSVYNVTLVSRATSSGCADTITKQVKAFSFIKAQINVANTIGCHPFTVNLNNNSSGASGLQPYVWNLGDGSFSNNTNISKTYYNSGVIDSVYKVILTATSSHLCQDKDSVNITVHPYVKANFSMPVAEGCQPFNVEFTNSSKGTDSYIWDFGNGKTSVLINPTQIFTNTNPDIDSIYNVRLIAYSSSSGCADTIINKIKAYSYVKAKIIPNISIGCHPLDVKLINQAGGHSSSTLFNWYMGDGSISIEKEPAKTYINLGKNDTSYKIVLKLKTNHLCESDDSTYITVHPRVKADFSMPISEGCQPFTVQFNNTSIQGKEYIWNFDDGSVITDVNAIHSFCNNDQLNDRIYNVKLTAISAEKCRDSITRQITAYHFIKADFNISDSLICDGEKVSLQNTSQGADGTFPYYWVLGNGSETNIKNPSNIEYRNTDPNNYNTYPIFLKVTSRHFCTDSITKYVKVYPDVSASFNFIDKSTGCQPFTVRIDNLSSGQDTCYWEFSDGSPLIATINQKIIEHTYTTSQWTNALKYNIKLKAKNKGCSDSLTKQVTVFPYIEANFNSLAGCSPFVAKFTDLSKTTDSSLYKWDLGDGLSSYDREPTHEYINFTGNTEKYNVKLTVTSKYKCKSEIIKTVELYPVPKAEFSVEKNAGCTPFEVKFKNNSKENNTDIWNFDDGSEIEYETSPVHIFKNETSGTKTYNVKLKIISQYGCTDSVTQKVYSYPAVNPDFIMDVSIGCNPLDVNFTNTTPSYPSATFEWDFGDNTGSDEIHPSHRFELTNPSANYDYVVTLKAKTLYGCQNHVKKLVSVYAQPKAGFRITPDTMIFPSKTIIITDLTSPQNDWDYIWKINDSTLTGSITKFEFNTDPINNPQPEYQYTITLLTRNSENINCFSSYTRKAIVFSPIPIPVIEASETQGCAPLNIKFDASSSKFAYKGYFWDLGTNEAGHKEPYSNRVSFNNIFEEPGTYTVTLTARGARGDSSTTKIINVFQPPKAYFTYSKGVVKLYRDTLYLNNNSEFADNYYWDLDDDKYSYDDNPWVVYQTLGDKTITLTATTNEGCSDKYTSTVKAEENCIIVLPNAFLPLPNNPNNPETRMINVPDNNNDIFHPVFVEGIIENTYNLKIFNRWGELLIERNDINQGWNGYFKGKLCEPGVYVYKVSGMCTDGKKQFIETKTFTIIR
jgi:gliding motility-associated-like protein